MSDNESSDGMEELQALIKEYQTEEDNVHEDKNLKQKNDEPLAVPMEKVVFGDKEALVRNFAKAVDSKSNLVFPESNADGNDSVEGERKRKPAWTDADDEVIPLGEVKRPKPQNAHLNRDQSYKNFLTSRFTRIVSQPEWASLDKSDKDANSDSEDDELLQSAGFLDRSTSETSLRQHNIHWKQLKDLNRATHAEGVINSIQFHPTSTAALVAGDAGIASIYCVDGYKNEKLHNIRFRDFPIKCARISPSGTKAYFGALRPHYYAFDLLSAQETKLILPKNIPSFNKFELSSCGKYIAVSGKLGGVHLLTANTNELLHSFKQQNYCTGLCFTSDSSRLFSLGGNSVNIFSLRKMRLEHSFTDDGCIKGSAIQIAPNQRLLATGSKEGVVNVYDYEKVLQTKTPQPEKTFMNLTTSISCVRFNHTSELLAMCSFEAPSAVKLAQFPSGSVFANFPGFQPVFGKIRTIEFSPHSGFMAFGNQHKKALLFRLKHFKNY